MSNNYYNSEDLKKFGNIADFQKNLGDKFFDYYGEVFKDSELTAREKSLIALDLNLNCTSKHISEFDIEILGKRSIKVGQHCYGYIAGAGSSCGGAVA